VVAQFSGKAYFSRAIEIASRVLDGGPTSPVEEGFRTESASAPLEASEDDLALRFTQRLRFYAAKRLGDLAAAEDVAQETLRIVVEAVRANRIRNQDALPGFVFQTARNICFHWIRSTSREKSAFARLERQPHDETAAADALTTLISAERARVVRAALKGLDADDQRLLSMFYYEDLNADEISAVIGITTAAVRVRKHRALRLLAAELHGRHTK
jgi:RNA polymerase sigma-70 factor (ECF subfamily)